MKLFFVSLHKIKDSKEHPRPLSLVPQKMVKFCVLQDIWRSQGQEKTMCIANSLQMHLEICTSFKQKVVQLIQGRAVPLEGIFTPFIVCYQVASLLCSLLGQPGIRVHFEGKTPEFEEGKSLSNRGLGKTKRRQGFLYVTLYASSLQATCPLPSTLLILHCPTLCYQPYVWLPCKTPCNQIFPASDWTVRTFMFCNLLSNGLLNDSLI